ncbi:hypothetical protein [Bartonella grahamii]|uniref:hypothetical protein n=1 Tax=Bartonella grahamii TaxID=33045 RepID=UPI002E7BABE8|nr:hypothetical protein [Bartonella grahamii]
MPLPYHTHKFTLEPATKEEVKEGVLDRKVLAPVSVGSAAAYEVEYFATAAQGKKADDAIAKRDIGALAYKDKVTICDIEASGEARENAILSGAGWVKISPLGIGDMKAATYDPDNVGANAFSMENMHEGPTKKILTTDERSKLHWLSPNGPTMQKWRMGDEGVRYPISPLELKNTINYFSLSKSLGMSKSVYDPNKIAKDVFDMENMREGNTHLILTSQERAQVAKIDKIEDVAQHAKESVQQGLNTASEAKDVANVALSTAKDAQAHAVDAKNTAEAAQKTGDRAQAVASVAQDTAHSVQKKVDLIQPLEKQDWIDGTKTIDALISPANLMASIKVNGGNSSGGGYKPVEILMTESGDIPWPEGTTEDTELEIWAWGGGNAGDWVYDGSGGAGGCCTYLRTKKKFIGKSSVSIGKGGVAARYEYGGDTTVGYFIRASGGRGNYSHGGINGTRGSNASGTGYGGSGGYGCAGGDGGDGGNGGAGGDGGSGGDGGDHFLCNGGVGGNGGDGGPRKNGNDNWAGRGGAGGNGGDSIYGCGGRGGKGGDSGIGGEHNWSGNGGRGGHSIYGGGGGGGPFGRGSKAKDGSSYNGFGGYGGNSVYGGGGGGSRGSSDGGHSMWGGKGGTGGSGNSAGGGGGGGYFDGKSGGDKIGGDGGDGAVLIKVYL